MAGHDIFDLVLIVILLGFGIRGLFNGLIAEVSGVVSILLGFWVAYNYYELLAPHLATVLSEPAWAKIAAWLILFFAVLIIIAIIARILQKICTYSFIGWLDKLAGALFGIIKGALICSVLLFVFLKFFGNADFIKDSRMIPFFKETIQLIKEFLPPEIISLLARIGF